jgi:hypothetical protein
MVLYFRLSNTTKFLERVMGNDRVRLQINGGHAKVNNESSQYLLLLQFVTHVFTSFILGTRGLSL